MPKHFSSSLGYITLGSIRRKWHAKREFLVAREAPEGYEIVTRCSDAAVKIPLASDRRHPQIALTRVRALATFLRWKKEIQQECSSARICAIPFRLIQQHARQCGVRLDEIFDCELTERAKAQACAIIEAQLDLKRIRQAKRAVLEQIFRRKTGAL